jgi:hypothetical protein
MARADYDCAMGLEGCVVNRYLLPIVLLVCVLVPRRSWAEGEPVNGFPDWSERVLLEWTNRARSEPQVEMTACGANCGDAACYTPVAPLRWNGNLARSARFHADNMTLIGFQSFTSACTLVANIAALYPDSCDGSAGCACTGGTAACNPTCTGVFDRLTLFLSGNSGLGESIAGFASADPDMVFKLWLFENFPTHQEGGTCAESFAPPVNADRWQLLKLNGLAGFGMRSGGVRAVVDYGFGSGSTAKIPSGAHFPQQAASVDAWANWFDAAGPATAKIDVDGICSDMTLERGSSPNGAWHAVVTGMGSGCHRYFFAFRDDGGNDVLYPTTGSLAIGDGSAQCPDFSSAAPGGCLGFDRIFAYGYEP